jgi:hypothetical protein
MLYLRLLLLLLCPLHFIDQSYHSFMKYNDKKYYGLFGFTFLASTSAMTNTTYRHHDPPPPSSLSLSSSAAVASMRSVMRILLLRKGVPRPLMAHLKAEAEAVLQCHFEIEITTATTHLVSILPFDQVLSWLQLPALPHFVMFKSIEWLQQEIESARSSSSIG